MAAAHASPHRLRLMFEWRGGCLWCADDATRAAFGVGPVEDRLPLSPNLLARLNDLSRWHDGALDWDDPAGPGPWPADEEARFEHAAEEALAAIRAELGAGYIVEYRPL